MALPDINFFRDLSKNPDKYNIPGVTDSELKAELEADRAERLRLGKEVDKKNEKLSFFAESYAQTINKVSAAKLKSEYANDAKEATILEERKKFVLGRLQIILEDVKRYVSVTNNFNSIVKNKNNEDLGEYRDSAQAVDTERKIIHDKLVSDIKILIRLVNINFNKNFSESERLESEQKMADRKGMSPADLKQALSEREYQEFDKSAFLFDKLPNDVRLEREIIKDWALVINSDLDKLNEDLKDNK
jgi:hypothetical protein